MQAIPYSRSTSPVEDRRQDFEMVRSLRKIIQAFEVQSRHLSSTVDVTLPQLLSLIVIEAEGGIVARELADRVYIGASSLVGILDRLESKGLIGRTRDPKDRRRVLLVASDSGRRLLAKAPSPFGEAFERSFHQLPRAEQRQLAISLRRLADLV